MIADDVTAQTSQIIANLRAVFQAAGRDLHPVVKVTVFLTDMVDFAAMNAVYARAFEAPYPARSTIAVQVLPLGARVEMECLAQWHYTERIPIHTTYDDPPAPILDTASALILNDRVQITECSDSIKQRCHATRCCPHPFVRVFVEYLKGRAHSIRR